MPFTFSHPAIVLPATYLNKKWYSITALIVGSMIPDFEYFIRMRDLSKYSHTWTGLLWFDIPLALLVIFIFHNVVRNSLIDHLPFSLNVRFSKFEEFKWNKYFQENIIVVLVSLIVGIASHLLWDDFTHEGGFFVESIPFLRMQINVFNHMAPLFVILQYGCSVLGGIVVMMAVLKLPEGKKTKHNNILNYWLLVTLITIFVVNVRLFMVEIYNTYINAGDIIVVIISGGLIGITAVSVVLKEKKKRNIYVHLNRINSK
ncbi:MAG: DUF4184 family protein [Bacteroidota bacterium]|nr:DUF4184 family protein [Bacteroidota bacterium]